MSFETAMGQLEEIIRGLENGQTDLENSINHYTRGTQLKTHCENTLAAAKLRVEKIIAQDGATVSVEPFDADE